MKKQKLLVISTSLLVCLCVSCASGDSSSSASKTSLKSSETTSSYVESNSESSSISSNDSSFKFSSETTAAAYIEDLMNATKDNNFTLEYNDGESTYQDIITPSYATIRDEYNGYVVLDSYNSNDTFLKDKILYTFINENNKPNLSLPTVNSSSSGTTIARSIDDINYIKKAFSESTPLDANAITIGEDGIVTLKDTSYFYYNAMNDLIQIFHTSSISYWSLDHITLSKTETTFTMDFYYSSSDTPVASATIKNVGTSKSEVVEANMDNFKLPEGNIGYYDLNDIRDNRFTVKSTFSKVSESGSEVIGVVGSNMSLNKYEYITYDTTGENIENISSCINKDGEMCTIQIDGKNEVTYSDSGYTWDSYFYDFSQYLDPQAFRTSTSEEHDYEYFGVHYTSILGGLTYSSTSSYGNLRHLYLDETDGEVSSFTAVFEDVVDTDNVTKHVEIQIEILDDRSFTEVTPFSSSSSDEIFVSAFESSFGGETSYKATIKSTEGSVENVTYVIYFDTTTSSIIREKYTTSDGISSIESVDGYKLMSSTANDGITYFTYDLETKIAKADRHLLMAI